MEEGDREIKRNSRFGSRKSTPTFILAFSDVGRLGQVSQLRPRTLSPTLLTSPYRFPNLCLLFHFIFYFQSPIQPLRKTKKFFIVTFAK
ncbi:Uncharacterized protein APZ42_006687 [Daphnia magna]|uniref:Uncharacterized protein n=1 Tax=Daphnia magna TaxID=35525 RepID=A0A162D365_9CRUS|nr:Uncharacterized protein APZ42_006687 [Daphnia magna]